MAKRKKQKSMVGVFFKTLLSILAAFLVIAGILTFAASQLGFINFGAKNVADDSVAKTKNNNSFLDSIMGRGVKLNVAFFGVDAAGTRTDVIFVIHFDSKAKKLDLVSVPRDTKINIEGDVKRLLDDKNRYYVSPCRINAVHAYARDDGPKAAVMELERLLGISIDHYVKVNFEGFRSLVDAIGGVDFYVPQDMRWDMSDTGDININLKEGMQHLDGAKAEQLVRFRRYKQGDVARVEVQQAFLRAAAEKILSTDTILNNASDYISACIKYVTTDVSLVDAVKYVRYIKDIDVNNIRMETIPGMGVPSGDYVYDPEATKELVDEVFYSVAPDPNAPQISSKTKRIEVANGGTISGLAGKTQEYLINEGFDVPEISTYEGERTSYTRIIVGESGMGNDLKKYFGDDAKILVKPEMITNGTDIKIILGTDATEPSLDE